MCYCVHVYIIFKLFRWVTRLFSSMGYLFEIHIIELLRLFFICDSMQWIFDLLRVLFLIHIIIYCNGLQFCNYFYWNNFDGFLICNSYFYIDHCAETYKLRNGYRFEYVILENKKLCEVKCTGYHLWLHHLLLAFIEYVFMEKR